MPRPETLIFRASLGSEIHRDIEVAERSTLFQLAQAVVASFDFDFDHAFGFYSGLTGDFQDSRLRYELFADMGEGDGAARSVKKTRAVEAFPALGAKMRFVFDYGDEWEFLVALVERGTRMPKVKLPRVLAAAGEAPSQYPDAED